MTELNKTEKIERIRQADRERIDKSKKQSNNKYNPYIEQNGNVYYMKEEERKYLGNFTVEPLREITLDDGEEDIKVLELRGKLFNGTPLDKLQIKMRDFDSLNWISSQWGINPSRSVGNANKDRDRHYIKQKALKVDNTKVYSHTGFRVEGEQLLFLHNSGAINKDNVEVQLDNGLEEYCFYGGNDISEKEAVKETLEMLKVGKKEITYPLLAFMFLCPLNHFFVKEGYAPAFALFIKGLTGTYKTSISTLFMGAFTKYKPLGSAVPKNFNSTMNSIEKFAFNLKDVPLFIDDYHPTNAVDKHKMDNVFQLIVRSAGDNASRSRLNADCTAKKTYKARGLFLLTGEDTPNIAESGLARCFIIPTSIGDIDLDKIRGFKDRIIKVNKCMEYFIFSLIQSRGVKNLGSKFIEIQRKTDNKNIHTRLISNVAWLKVAFDTFIDFAFNSGILSGTEADSYKSEMWDILIYLSKVQSEEQAKEKPVNLFISALNEMIGTNEIYLEPYSNKDNLSLSYDDCFTGFNDKDYLYLLSGKVFGKVKEYYKGQGKDFPISSNTLYKQLSHKGLIIKQNDKNTIKIRTGNKTISVLKVDIKKYNEIIDNI